MRPGDLLANRFQLELQAGSGGMGRVFRARDRFSGGPVAVKLLRERRDNWDARFLREAEMLASLHHPAIVRHVAHGALPGGERYLVMEWLHGEDLATRLARGPLPPLHTLALARQVADALAFAHARGVVHRDLKPQNLWLLDGDPLRVKVLDFGVARMDSHSSLSHTAVIGTPGYIAPEQVRGAFDVDPRADVFALGCVLHECVTGQPLFRSDHLIGLLAKILLEPAPSLRATRPEVPLCFDALVGEMLAKDRAQRPADGGVLRRRLATPSAREASGHETLSMIERRTRTLLLIGSGVGHDGSTPDFAQRTPGIAEQRMRGIVCAHGGSLEELADGTAIVSFGDSIATDRAARAARCALALLPVCRQRALSLVTGRSDGTPIGVAIDRGTAALARVSAEQAGGPIAIDALTAGLLDGRFEVAQGRLTRERALSHGVRSLLGKATACVGRELELAALRSAVDASIEERTARAMLVSARPGIGKSRLAVELVDQLRRDRPTLSVWIARGDPLRTSTAFGLLAQLLRAQLALREDDPLPQRQASIRARVGDDERVASFLGELLAAPFDDKDNPALQSARRDPQWMLSQLTRAFVDFVRAQLHAGPLLWLLEDLHWADLPSIRLVDAALAQLGEQPWLVLGLARPELLERAPGLWEERGLSVMHLEPLSARAGAELVAQAVDLPLDDPRVVRLVELAHGNAFYLEELARTMDKGALPETVLAMIEARLGSLDHEQRRVLRAASIFGEACWEGGLSRLMGGELDPVRLHHCLAQLVEQELLLPRPESRFAGERELAFRHALLREGAYAQLTAHDRQLGHRLAADWLEQHGEPSHAVLALHLERGGELERAGLRYASAAQADNLGADRDAALSHARSALRCGVPRAVASELHHLIIMVFGQRSEFEAARPHVEALAHLGTRDGVYQLAYQLVPIMQRTLYADSASLEELSAALERAVEAPLSEATLDVFGAVLGWSHFELNAMAEYALSRRTDGRYAAQLARFADREPMAAGWLALRASYQSSLFADDVCAGLADARRALWAFERAQHPGGCALANTFIGMHAQALGDLEQVARALDATRDVELGTLGSLRDLMRVVSLLDAGEAERADAYSLTMIASTRSRHAAERGRAHWARAVVLLKSGAVVDSQRELALAVSMLARWPVQRCGALLSSASAALAARAYDEALALCERAQLLFDDLYLRGYRGMICRYLPVRRAEVFAAAGRLEQARAQAAVANQRIAASAERISDPACRAQFLECEVHNRSGLALARRLG